MRIKFRISSLIILAIFTVLSAMAGCNPWLYFSVVIFIIILTYCSFNFTEHAFFILFLLAFFTFLIGGQIANDFFGHPMRYVSSKEDYDYLNFTIFLSLIFLGIGHMAGIYFDRNKKSLGDLSQKDTMSMVRWVSKAIFYFFSLSWFAVLLEQSIVVQNNRYVDLYTFESRLPGIVDQLAEACPIILCIFLAAYPSKKEARIPLLMVFAYAILSLLIGRRIFFVTYLLLVIAYLLIRTYGQEQNKEEWIDRKRILLIIVLTPFILVFLYSYRYIRYNKTIEATSLMDAFIGFFAQQGFSANLIVTGRRYSYLLTDDIYSFLSTIRFLRINVFSRYVLGLDYTGYYRGDPVHLAKYSGAFSRAMSYILIPGLYKRGYGLGSCYIAELYHDFGYAGICLGNFVYGFLFGKVIKLKSGSFRSNVIALVLFLNFLTVARYNFDRPFAVFISFNFWTCVAIVYLITNFLSARRNR